MWEHRRLTALWAFTACYGDSFTSTFTKLLSQAVRDEYRVRAPKNRVLRRILRPKREEMIEKTA
jgi:hypothetical protein